MAMGKQSLGIAAAIHRLAPTDEIPSFSENGEDNKFTDERIGPKMRGESSVRRADSEPIIPFDHPSSMADRAHV